MTNDPTTDRPSVLLGVTGSIAAFRAADIVRFLIADGCDVHVVLTENGARFVGPVTFQTLSRNPVTTDLWSEIESRRPTHIDLADRAHVLAVAPCTANVVAKLAHGIADDALSSIALATRGRLVIAPAMNVHMFEHPATQQNLDVLRGRGAVVVGPGEGNLACGYEGRGRMAEPRDVADAVLRAIAGGKLDAVRPDGAPLSILVAAGPTREPVDAVRALSNRSSGRMGYAVAAAARDAGADVTLITGPSALTPPAGVRTIRVETAAEMAEQTLAAFPACDILVMAAAVADYAPEKPVDGKRKRDRDPWDLRLVPTRDILAEAGRLKTHQTIVGFAAETDDLERRAREKLERKGIDLIVANDVSRPDSGFDTETNEVLILGRDGPARKIPKAPKAVVAYQILAAALSTHKPVAPPSSERNS